MKLKYKISLDKKVILIIPSILVTVIIILTVLTKIYYLLAIIGFVIFIQVMYLVDDIRKIFYYNGKNEGIVFVNKSNGEIVVNSYEGKNKICVKIEAAIFKKKVIEFLSGNATYIEKQPVCYHHNPNNHGDMYDCTLESITKYYLNNFELPINDLNVDDILMLERTLSELAKNTKLRCEVDKEYRNIYL